MATNSPDEVVFAVAGSTANPAERISLDEAGLREREHLQEWVIAHPEIIGPGLMIVTFEFDRWSSASGSQKDRLDVLGFGEDGRIVVAELKRGHDWIRAFQPDGELLDLLLETLRAEADTHTEQPAERRGELLGQLQRLRDLYVLGDLTKPQYVMHRQAIEEELQRLGPPAEPAIDRARALLGDFQSFWDLETEPAERRKLLLSLFEQVWAHEGQIVAVQPHDAFLPYFEAADETLQHRCENIGAEGGSVGSTCEPRRPSGRAA
jgi:hypothetical protein